MHLTKTHVMDVLYRHNLMHIVDLNFRYWCGLALFTLAQLPWIQKPSKIFPRIHWMMNRPFIVLHASSWLVKSFVFRSHLCVPHGDPFVPSPNHQKTCILLMSTNSDKYDSQTFLWWEFKINGSRKSFALFWEVPISLLFYPHVM